MRTMIATIVAAALLHTATAAAPAIEVTRFHQSPPQPGQSIAVMPAPGMPAGTLEFATYANSVVTELAKLGFKPVAAGQPADLVATFSISDQAVGQERKGPPITIGIGGSTGGWRGGVGGGVTFPVGGNRTRTIMQTQLQMQIRRAADNVAVWEGRAVQTGSNDPLAARMPVLARALLGGFPGPNGQTVKVKAR
ncbi:MAG: DUF4136 domain-containing protein [Sphingomonadales bacterium]|jgi:hypothetical protein